MQFPISFSELELTLYSFQMRKYGPSGLPWHSKEGKSQNSVAFLHPEMYEIGAFSIPILVHQPRALVL